MIDLHIHLLPNIDDGPAEISTSISMLELAVEFGISTLVATPHLLGALDESYAALVDRRFHELLPHATTMSVELQTGYEVRLTPDIGRRLKSGEPIALGDSRVVLLELPFAGWPIFTEQALFDVLSAGFTPLLAHPERYEAAVEQPSRILDLRQRGVLMQVTTGSLAGLFGKRAKSLAERLLREGAVDILASDAHSAGRRFVSVAEGLAHAENLIGRDRVRQLTTDNPKALLSGCSLPLSKAVVGPSRPNEGPGRAWQIVRGMLPGR